MRGILLAGALVGAQLVTLPRAAAAPTWVRVSIVGDAATSFGVAWNTLSGPAEAEVEYGTTSGQYSGKVTGTVGPAISAELGAVSEATITGLKPYTTYFYRVGGPQGGFSSEKLFRSGPPNHPQCSVFSFVYAGDSRAESWETDKGSAVKWPVIAMKAATYQPAFMLHGGDFVQSGSNQKQWADTLAVTSVVSGTLPVMYGIGNHDDGPGEGEGANFNRLLHLPRSDPAAGGSDTEDFYAFSYGNAILIALSTEGFTGGTSKFAKQAAWLDKVLSQTDKLWKLVYLHKPVYTTELFGGVSHPSDEAGQNAAFVPLFNKHHVDIVLGSHNHFYERFAPSACQNGASKTPCPVGSFDKGTVYITSGGGGAFPIFLPGGTDAVRVAASGSHHFLHFQIQHRKLTLKVLDEDGAPLDQMLIDKGTPTPDPCAAPLGGDGGPAADGGGADDGSARADAAATIDAARPGDATSPTTDTGIGTKPAANDGGCSCRIRDASSAGLPALTLLGLALLIGRRRRRR